MGEDPGGGGGAPLGADQLPTLLARIEAALSAQRERIDALNVFPVPDGDTGTNMTLTIAAAAEALRDAGELPPEEAGRVIIRAALRGARGNSGVILSQVVRAVVDVIAGHARIDATLYASALDHARSLAYGAVAQPVEGTILTVIGAAAAEAGAAVEAGDDLIATSARVCAATREAVDATRDQLEVLRDAGVVDAGARGFEVVLAAVHAHLTGQEHAAAADHPDVQAGPYRVDGPQGCDGSLAYRYEVQYLLDADDDAAQPLRRALEVLGDSVVVVAAGGLLNVHVHTDDVGGAIEEGVAYGRPSNIEVTHLGDQIAALRADDPPAAIGAVAVVSGAGAVSLARSLGAVPVEGAAGQLPSVADLLNACGAVRAETIVLLPGHPNAVPTARQASDVAVAEGGRSLTVIDEAVSLPAVLAGLAVLDPGAPAERVVADLRDAAARVRCGEVVGAVRDASTPVGPVRAGQPLAVIDGEVVEVATDRLAALGTLAERLGVADGELITLLVGAEVSAPERRSAEEVVRDAAGDVELEVVAAGQRPAAYVLSVE